MPPDAVLKMAYSDTFDGPLGFQILRFKSFYVESLHIALERADDISQQAAKELIETQSDIKEAAAFALFHSSMCRGVFGMSNVVAAANAVL